eukprot:gene38359-50355_t
MDLAFTPEEQQFREDIRAWVHANLPADIQHKVRNSLRQTREDMQRWAKILGAKGWLGHAWPKEFGGPGWNSIQKHLFEEECALAGAPRVVPFGPVMVAPVIMAFGNAEQQQRFLPGIASGDVWWSQGYSEPGSGSDLASLRTKAVREGDFYIVNGQKTWTTLAQTADWIFCLVRTSNEGKPQEGISFLLIDMKTPGITVKPIIMADGGHEVNEVFFDNVKVPVENLVGKENEGWTCAKFLPANERLGIAAVPQSKRGVEALKDIARAEQDNGKPLIENQSFAEKIADLEIQVTALEFTELRVLSQMAHGGQPGPEVLPQAQKMATTRPSTVAMSESWIVIHVPLSNSGQAAKTASN